MPETPEMGVPPLGEVRVATLVEALRRGAADLKRAPGFALVFAGFYVLVGRVMMWITWATGQSYWLVLAAIGFPRLGPFAALGFYDVRRPPALCLGKGIGDALFHFGMNGVAYQIQHILLGSEVFIKGTDGNLRRPGNLACSGFVKPLFCEKLNRRVDDLAPSLFNQFRIFNLRRNCLAV